MTLPIIIASIGAIAFLIGLFGGKIEIGPITYEPSGSIPPSLRWTASLTGIIFIGIAIWLGSTDGPPDTVSINLMNEDCKALDYYVDEELVVSIEAESNKIFKTNGGEHWVTTCIAGTNICSTPNQVNWTSQVVQRTIFRGSGCPVTITLISEHCKPLDYYVDDEFVVSVEAGSTTKFEITSGEHLVKVCVPGTNSCSESNEVSWTSVTETRNIYRGSNCE